ncbi:hypothetical protein AK830_g8969 [Neonectria ditissima]|uniref:Phthiocerol/phthiodiolone dimycocerosyl transferase C-terminal domain-containing protein n=1 Tax=Neonectria ditissima TaxID=78410 RepID=A0A0P7BD82_9HYPO|nr:hypothetical protein AK830_g8969 [Neonectria ditissima]
MGSLQDEHRYKWHKTPDGLWQRDIDEAERFYASFCRTPHDADAASFAVTASASFAVLVPEKRDPKVVGRDVEEALRVAWIALRGEHPMLGAWIQYDSEAGDWKKVYSSFCDAGNYTVAQQEWLSQTFLTAQSKSCQEWSGRDHVFKLPTLAVVRSLPGQNDVVSGSVYLQSPHDMVDGIGILQLLDQFFDLASRAYLGATFDRVSYAHEVNRLSPPLRVALGIPAQATKTQTQRFAEITAQNATTQADKPFLGLPLSATGGADRNHRMSVALPEAATTLLLASCKLHNVTITHAVSAAVVVALRDLQSSSADAPVVQYTNQALVNLRHLCRPPWDASAVGNYHMIASRAMGISIATAPPEDSAEELLSIAHQFRDYYASVRPGPTGLDRDVLAFAPMTWDLFTPKPTSTPPPPSQTAAVAISSLGNVSAIVKSERDPFQVTDAWVAGETLGTGVSVFVHGWAGTTRFSVIFNSRFHERDHVERFQQRVLECLERGLGWQ